MRQRQTAILTGASLLLMTLVAIYSFGYAYPEVFPMQSNENLLDHYVGQTFLFQNMIIGIVIILGLDLIVSFTWFKYFKNDNRSISLLAGLLRFIYTLEFGLATYTLVKSVNISALTNNSIINGTQQFQMIWNIGLTIFAIHVCLIGILMKQHKKIPPALWIITLIAGCSYILVHVLKLNIKNSDLVNYIETALAIPKMMGELLLAFGFIIKGGKKKMIPQPLTT